MKTTTNYKLKKPDGSDVVNIQDFNDNADIIDVLLKEFNRKIDSIEIPVTSVNSKTGAIELKAKDINCSDGNSLEYHLDDKVDKIPGKGLSTYDFTNYYKTKIEGLEQGANKYVHPDTHPANMISGLHTVATSGSYNDLKYTPYIPSVYDTLTSSRVSDALSANQGKVLNELIGILDKESVKKNIGLSYQDFNDAREPGFYSAFKCKNSPDSSELWGLVVLRDSGVNAGPIHQIAFKFDSNEIRMRYHTPSGGWKPWKAIFTEEGGVKAATGIYVGNGVTGDDGNFVNIGFKPKFIFITEDSANTRHNAAVIYSVGAEFGICWDNENSKFVFGRNSSGYTPYKYTDKGFYVKNLSDSNSINIANYNYHYFCIG